MGHPIGDRSRP